VAADLVMADYAVWEAAFDRLRERCGDDLDSSSALVLLAKSFLEQPLNKEEQESRKAFQVVYHKCSECANAWVQTSDGVEGVERSVVEQREKFADVEVLEDEDAVFEHGSSDPQLSMVCR